MTKKKTDKTEAPETEAPETEATETEAPETEALSAEDEAKAEAKRKMDALIASRRPETGVAYQQGKPVARSTD